MAASRRLVTEVTGSMSPKGTQQVSFSVRAEDMERWRQEELKKEADMVSSLLDDGDEELDSDDDFGGAGAGVGHNAAALATKYGVGSPGSGASGSPRRSPRRSPRKRSDFCFSEQEVNAVTAAHQQNQALVAELSAKTRQIETLEALVAALKPLPGMDVAKYREMLESAGDGHGEDLDVRDAKIVELSKKMRGVNVALQRERDRSRAAARQVAGKDAEIELLREQLDAVASPAVRNKLRHMQTEARRRGSSIEADASIVSPAEVVEQAQKAMKDAAAVRSQNDELKHKLEVQRIENNQLNTTLKREIGDGDLFNAAIAGEGWRGRAQQITLLKTKVKRLERELRNGGHGSPGTQNFQRSRDAKDVDARAEAHVKSISTARQALLASQREEIAQLKAEQKESRQRLDAARSRLSTAQTDAARLRGQMKVMIDKADTDDSLIQELREQLSQTRRAAGMGGGSIALALGSTGGSSSGASPKAASHGAPRSSKSNDDLRAEIERLKKLTKRQGDVIDRQERTISGLRSELHDVQAHVRG